MEQISYQFPDQKVEKVVKKGQKSSLNSPQAGVGVCVKVCKQISLILDVEEAKRPEMLRMWPRLGYFLFVFDFYMLRYVFTIV